MFSVPNANPIFPRRREGVGDASYKSLPGFANRELSQRELAEIVERQTGWAQGGAEPLTVNLSQELESRMLSSQSESRDLITVGGVLVEME